MAEQQKRIRRRLPCPLYDVDCLENWLKDMSEKGLLLVKNSYSRGRVSFKRIEPHSADYRLTAGARSAAALDAGRPWEDMTIGQNEKQYAWYVAGRLGEYHVYRTLSDGHWEPARDTLARSIAQERVKRRLKFDVALAVLCLVLYPLLLFFGRGLLLSMGSAGSWLFLAGLALVLWLLIDSAATFRRLKKPREREKTRWGWRTFRYYGKNALQLLAVVCLLGLIGAFWVTSWLGTCTVSPAAYAGEPPFARLTELAGETVDVREALPRQKSQVREWRDWLSPRNLTWHESADLATGSGGLVEGGLYVDYHRTWNSFLAQRMAEEYVRRDRWTRGFRELEPPALDADFVAAYCSDPQFPTVVVRRGNVVVRALYYLNADQPPTLDQWAPALLESLEG